MKFQFNIEQKDMENCYRAFFVPKENKANQVYKWTIFSAFALSVIAFIVLIATAADGIWQMSILMIVLGLITAVAFFTPLLLEKMSIKHYEKSQLKTSDRVEVTIENDQYTEKLFDGKTLLSETTFNLDEITRLEEDDNNFYIIFGLNSMSIIKKVGVKENVLKTTGELLHKGLVSQKKKRNQKTEG